jgi:hypothetical protein
MPYFDDSNVRDKSGMYKIYSFVGLTGVYSLQKIILFGGVHFKKHVLIAWKVELLIILIF